MLKIKVNLVQVCLDAITIHYNPIYSENHTSKVPETVKSWAKCRENGDEI